MISNLTPREPHIRSGYLETTMVRRVNQKTKKKVLKLVSIRLVKRKPTSPPLPVSFTQRETGKQKESCSPRSQKTPYLLETRYCAVTSLPVRGSMTL